MQIAPFACLCCCEMLFCAFSYFFSKNAPALSFCYRFHRFLVTSQCWRRAKWQYFISLTGEMSVRYRIAALAKFLSSCLFAYLHPYTIGSRCGNLFLPHSAQQTVLCATITPLCHFKALPSLLQPKNVKLKTTKLAT